MVVYVLSAHGSVDFDKKYTIPPRVTIVLYTKFGSILPHPFAARPGSVPGTGCKGVRREPRARFRARQLVRDVRDQMGVLMRNVDDDIFGIDDSLRLPMGTFTEWSAVFQNVFINAMNAMLDSSTRRIAVSSRAEDRDRVLVIQDTGSGVDLATSEELFKPFERRLQLSPERRALGAGGTGLGLTIVRMIANNIGCKVSFVQPDEGFNTAFQISWSERK